jgi:hypothetical protein
MVAVTGSVGWLAGIDAGAAIGAFYSNAETVDELRGAGDCFNASVTVVVGIAIAYCGWLNSRGEHRYSLFIGPSVGIKIGGSGGRVKTGVTKIRGWKGDVVNRALSAANLDPLHDEVRLWERVK